MADDEKMSPKIHDHWLKIHTTKSSIIFYAIIFVAMFLLISGLNTMSNSSTLSFGLTSHQILNQQETPKASDINPQLSIQESTEETDAENEDPLIPPAQASKEERMTWFRTQLPNLEILKPSNLTPSFHYRVLNFLNQDCSTLFHIIWLSPAKYFGKREFLTMDTLFKVQPQVCLLIISRSMDSKHGYRILKPLLDRGFKVLAITPDLPFLVKNTPAEAWLEKIKSGNKDPGYIPLTQNLSNLIRLAMLYKYGGVYLDTDLIIMKDFSMFRNTVGAQSADPVTKKWLRLNGAVMIFDINHPILWDLLQEFSSTFDGNRWGYNGPYLVSRVIERVGNTPGYNITILPPKAFYPVDWIKIGGLFKKPKTNFESMWVENTLVKLLYEGDTYALHLWNKKSRELDIEEGSVMARLIAVRCIVCNYMY
ncbi:uncharacterized protein LOC133293205 [Gastrolobium bilobum]|uniref:uncharacterized protein LOC133293205 n=1 Tax=Gastrolobium bilobum TaxID=150636 RepID=UPI002AB05655|nr:uncharacterized protein LOC133293205 [Gastrolobium bilobum]